MAYYTDLVPTMSSNTAPSGTASASSERSTTYSPWKSMDKSTSTWASSTAADKSTYWLQYEFASSQTVFVYSITATTTTTATPKSWTFQGYNSGTSSWDTLDTQTDITAWTSNEKKSFFTTNTTAYTKYRINVSAQNGGTYTEIAEFNMYAKSADVKISSERLDAELDITSIKISSEILNVDTRIDNVKLSSLSLQVEFDTATNFRMKHYSGGTWTGYPIKYWDGASWTTKTIKFYSGGAWNS